MHQFRDSQGRDWLLKLDLSIAKRMRDTGYDLLDEERLGNIAQDIYETVNAIYLVCRKQADERGLADDAFGEMLTECYEAAKDAFLEELRLFYMSLGLKAQARLVDAVMQAMTKINELVDRQLTEERLTKLVETKLEEAELSIDAELEMMSGARSTKSLA